MTMAAARRTARWQDDSSWIPAEPAFHASLRECANRQDGSARGSERLLRAQYPQKEKVQKQQKAIQKSEPGLVTKAAGWWQAQQALQTAKTLETINMVRAASAPQVLKPAKQPKAPRKGLLAHVWSTLRTRYMMAGGKRLRVAEVTSLGDKRFVALVSVEGREFLIGGGSGGVSLLTPLASVHQSSIEFRPGINEAGDMQ
jgi:hypothetical protein